MTVSTTANSITYAGDNVTTAFAFPFIFFAPTDLAVNLLDSVTGSEIPPPPNLNGGAAYDYTVIGSVVNGEYPGGATVTFNTAPLGGYTVSIERWAPAYQTVTLIDNAKFPAATINTEFDYLTVLCQQNLALIEWLQVGLQQAYIGLSPPPNPTPGMLWFWSDDGPGGGVLYVYYSDGSGSQWVPVNPESGYLSLGGGTMVGPIQGVTPDPASDDTTVPTTSWVKDVIASGGAGGFAPLASPVFTGNPTAPTPLVADNDTSIATTAFVHTVVAGAVGGSTPTGPAGGDLAGTYPNPTVKASVALGGNPTAPTQTGGTNNTTVATTAFVNSAIAAVPTIALDGFLYGLAISNSGTNGVIVAAGKCINSTNTVLITNAAPITKLITGAWVAGTGNAGLGTTVTRTANTWFHVFGGLASGVFDCYLDTSITAANKPAAFSSVRRLGSVRTAGGATPPLRLFTQTGDFFQLSAPPSDFSVNAPGTAAVSRTMTVPSGLKLMGRFALTGTNNSTTDAAIMVAGDPDIGPTVGITPQLANAAGGVANSYTQADIMTNVSSQISIQVQGLGDTNVTITGLVVGWFDTRGRTG